MDIRIAIPGLPIATPDPFAVGLGGSETAGLQLARAFARKGHEVTVFCEVPRPTRWQAVRLVPILVYRQPAARAGDLLLIQRDPQVLTLPHTAKAAFLWVHDMLLLGDAPALMAGMAAVDRLLTVSAWQAQQFRAVAPGLAEEQILVTRNGIDLELIAAGVRGAGERDPYRIVYSSRPERGLEVLLSDVFPHILAEEPRATVHLATYDHPAADAQPYYRHVRTLAEAFGDRVVQHGALPKRDLYRLMATAGLYLYPPPVPVHPEFAETSCITAMEAMACGLPWVSTDRGALTETVGDAGVLVPLNGAVHAGDGDVPERLAAAALRVMHDPEHAERLRAAGLARAAGLGWGGVADQLIAAAGADRTHAAPKPRVARPIQSSDSNVSAIRLDGVRAPTAQPAPAKAAILICTPSYDGKFTSGYVASLLRTTVELPASGVQVEWLTRTGDSLLPMARNKLIALAGANPNWTHLLLVDADIGWQPGDVLRLLAHNLPFVAGLYRVKESAMVFEYIRHRDQTPNPDSGLLELDGAGAGFLLLKREVFQRLIAAYPQSRIEHGVGLFTGADDQRAMASLYDFFPLGSYDGVFMSEDYAFCRRWREIGGRIWADLNIRLTHYGAHAYTGDPMSLFRPAAERAA